METMEVKDQRLDHSPGDKGKVEVPEELRWNNEFEAKEERADRGEDKNGELHGPGK
jgi:hypothetical protein